MRGLDLWLRLAGRGRLAAVPDLTVGYMRNPTAMSLRLAETQTRSLKRPSASDQLASLGTITPDAAYWGYLAGIESATGHRYRAAVRCLWTAGVQRRRTSAIGAVIALLPWVLHGPLTRCWKTQWAELVPWLEDVWRLDELEVGASSDGG